MGNNFQEHIIEWKKMNQSGRFAEARQYYFDKLFEEVIKNFENNIDKSIEPVDILFSILGFTPEPIILAAQALKPKKHIIIHDKEVTFNEDNIRFLPRFLTNGYEKIELKDDSFSTLYETLKEQMAFNIGSSYAINITGGKKSTAASAGIFARDYNCSVLYVDYNDYDPNLRRPLPGSERMNVVYTPTRDLPEIFHK